MINDLWYKNAVIYCLSVGNFMLDEVAAILKPKKRRTLDLDRARAISKLETVHAQSREKRQNEGQVCDEGVRLE